MLKQLFPVEREPPAPLSAVEQDEDIYDVWQEYSLEAALEEGRKAQPVVRPPDIWPDWSEGRPSSFRRTYDWEPFWLGKVRHHWHERTEALELEWQHSVSLSSIRKNPKALPSDYSYAWSGVYRIFQPGIEIPRFLDQDPTGTLYIGKAGTGKGNWSTLRTRVREAATRRHHVTQYWGCDSGLNSRHPWEAVYIEWAFRGTRLSAKGEKEQWANLAERWLLNTYRDSFGEFPPLNER